MNNIFKQDSFFISLCFLSLLGISVPAFALNPIQLENALKGDSLWHDFFLPTEDHHLEGYTDKDSANVGQTLTFYINAKPHVDPTYKLNIYRLGWYGGVGARKMMSPIIRTSVTQITPSPDTLTGMVQANWRSSYMLNIPKTWISGIYIATVVGRTTKTGRYIPFIVRDKKRSSDYLFQVSTTTWQAYNGWGGNSLYAYNSIYNNPAHKVSFNRPYDNYAGLGLLPRWEMNMLFFMERQGYDISYQTDIDTHVGNGELLNHKALLSVGHDEYWTKTMRDNIEIAQKHGISLGFFCANTAYWQIRMENAVGPLSPDKNRTIVSYKEDAATEDPFARDSITSNDHLVTALWRDPRWANRPENALIGVMYQFWPVNSRIVSTKSDPTHKGASSPHWAYTGTNATVGTTFNGLLGYETDRVFDNGKTPSGLEIIAASSVPIKSIDGTLRPIRSAHFNPAAPKSHATIYTKKCTIQPCKNPVSTVFATGSMQWVWGLNSFWQSANFENGSIKQITRNVLARMVNAPLPVVLHPSI